MSVPPSIILEGAILGLNYGLLAVGLVLIYRTSRVLNFAQGQLGAVAAVFIVKCYYDFGLNYWFALFLGLGLAAAAGALCELVLRRLSGRPRVTVMVATIGRRRCCSCSRRCPLSAPSRSSGLSPSRSIGHFTWAHSSFPPDKS